MTKIFTLLMATVTIILGIITLATPAHAEVNADSRVIMIDLPRALENATVVTVKFTLTNGRDMGVRTFTNEGFVNVLADNPADIATVTVKSGRRWLTPDNYMVTNIAVAPEGHGLEIGCPTVDIEGNDFMVSSDGSIVWLTSGKVLPALTLV